MKTFLLRQRTSYLQPALLYASLPTTEQMIRHTHTHTQTESHSLYNLKDGVSEVTRQTAAPLTVGWRTRRTWKIWISRIPNRLILIVYTQFSNVAAGHKYKLAGHGLVTRGFKNWVNVHTSLVFLRFWKNVALWNFHRIRTFVLLVWATLIEMSLEQWWNDTDRGKLKYWGKKIIKCVW